MNKPRYSWCFPVCLLFLLIVSVLSLLIVQNANALQVTLAWDPNIEPELSGYRVYYGTSSHNYFQNFGEGIDVGNVTTYTINDLTKGITYYFAVTAYDNLGFESDYSNEVSIPVHVISPDVVEVIPAGSTYNITWEAISRVTKFDLLYSPDNGLTWIPIKNDVADTSYIWTAPKPWGNMKNKCLVKVLGFDTKGIKVGADKSDAPFTIEVVKLTSPNGGETYTSDEPLTITWTTNATKKPVAKVKIYYTKDGGITWFPIDKLTDSVYLTEGPHSHPWTPTVGKAREECRVKVELIDENGNILGKDGSDSYFTIQP